MSTPHINANKETVENSLNPHRGPLSQCAAALAQVFGSLAPLTVSGCEALGGLAGLVDGARGDGISAYGPRWDRFAQEFNLARSQIMGPAPTYNLEESVYKEWTGDSSHPLAGRKGYAQGDPASHMLDLLNRNGFEIDSEPALSPDHLSCLLEFLSILLEARPAQEVEAFCSDHLDWIGELKGRMLSEEAPEALLSAIATTQSLIDRCMELNS